MSFITSYKYYYNFIFNQKNLIALKFEVLKLYTYFEKSTIKLKAQLHVCWMLALSSKISTYCHVNIIVNCNIFSLRKIKFIFFNRAIVFIFNIYK